MKKVLYEIRFQSKGHVGVVLRERQGNGFFSLITSTQNVQF